MKYFGKLLLTMLSVVLLGCSSSKVIYAPEAANLKSRYSCTDCKEPPFTARYRQGIKRLSYVGSRHESGITSKTFLLINDEFARLKPQIVIVEGIPRNAGINNPAFIAQARQYASDMESYYAVSLALNANAFFEGGEPGPQEKKEWLLGKGYTEKDIFGHDILQEIPVWKRQKSVAGFSDFYMSASQNIARMYRLDPTALMSETEFRAWYAQKNHKQFDAEAITVQETAPYNNEDSLFTQKMNFEISRIRDMAICRTIADALNNFDRVMVVYGAGHFGMEQDILTKMLGRPEMTNQVSNGQ